MTVPGRLITVMPVCLAVVLAVAGTRSAGAQPFPADNITLRAWLPLSSFTPMPANGNDCWGYVSPSGREYALMGLSNQVAVVEITNPSSPVILGGVNHSSSLWAGVKVYGDFAYASNEAGGGIDVIDLSNVDAGVVTLVRRVTVNGLSRAHTLAVNPDSGFLYVAGSNLNGGRLLALNLADPSNPSFAGQFTGTGSAYVHEAQVVSYTSGPYAGREIAFCSNGSLGLDVVDVTNKSAMFRMSRSTYPHLSYCHQGWLSEDRRYFYLNDETDDVNETVVFDVTNLSAPVSAGTYTSGLAATDHNQYVRDALIFESDYRSGLRVFSAASNPVNCVQVGWFDTYPENDNAGYEGAWSNYPFFPSRIVLISDMQRGLFVVDISALLPPCRGDADCSRMVGFDDIDYFVAALTGEQAWIDLHVAQTGHPPTCLFANCDVDASGTVDFDDIDPFVARLGQSCP